MRKLWRILKSLIWPETIVVTLFDPECFDIGCVIYVDDSTIEARVKLGKVIDKKGCRALIQCPRGVLGDD